MRYIILLVLNAPVILMALLGIITQFKVGRLSKEKFRQQTILWILLLVVLVSSFPIYNLFMGHPIFDSRELSLFDIVQTTAIIFMIYAFNRQRQKLEKNDKAIRDLHQELSIILSNKKP